MSPRTTRPAGSTDPKAAQNPGTVDDHRPLAQNRSSSNLSIPAVATRPSLCARCVVTSADSLAELASGQLPVCGSGMAGFALMLGFIDRDSISMTASDFINFG